MGAVFVFDRDGDVMAFKSEAEAADYMEAIDVDDGEYAAAYLADGTVLDILAPHGPDGPVVLQRTDDVDEGALLGRIQAYRRAQGGESAGVPDPIDFANDLRRREWELRWPRRPRWLVRRLHGRGPELLDPI